MNTNLTNFFNYAANTPQNTRGGNSQLSLRSEGEQQRVNESETRRVNHAIITQLSRNNHPITHRAIRYVAVLLMVFVVGIGNVWGDAITWDFTGRSSKQALSTDTEFEGSDGSTILTYKSPSNCVLHDKDSEDYLKMGGNSTYSSNVLNGRYFTLVAPSAAGTITVNYAGTVGNALISTGTNGTVIQSTITATANKECTSSAITGLTAGTTTIYIAFAAKSYINSITWTDAEAPSYASAYYSLVKTSMTGAALTASNATQQTGGSNLYADFANYYRTGNSTGYVNISFANPNTPIALNSNGSDCGRIKIYYGHTGAGKGFSLDVNSSTGVASYSATIANRIYVAEYTIPDGTSSISSLKMTGSGSSGLYICAIDILTYSSGGGGGDDPGDDPGDTPANYAVTHSLSNNVVAKSGDTGASAATEGTAYNAVFAPSKVGYTLPSTITVTIGGAAATAGTDYTWNSSTGAFQVPAAKVTGNIVVTIAGVAPVKTFKSDYSDFTQVGETNLYYTYLAQAAYTSYAEAGWTSYDNESFGSKKLKIDPATDEEISGSNANYGCLRSDRIMEYYLTGVTAVKFYVINGGSSGDPRVAKYTLNGGEETTLVSVSASTSNTGTIELDPSTNNTIRLYATSDVHVGAMKVTLPDPSCAAGVPGNITKGTASGGTGSITLTAAGDIASGDAWYWQSAADGTATNLGSGKTKDVNAAGTYYIRSYNTAGECWSDAKNVTVDAADLLTPITPSLSYDASVIVGNTLSPTLTGNTGNGSVSYALNNVTPSGSLTIDGATGVVTAVTAGGTATVTATIAANGNYAGNTATSGTITAVANPLGSGHVMTWNVRVENDEETVTTTSKTSTSLYLSSLSNISVNGSLTVDNTGKNSGTGKIKPTNGDKVSANCLSITFTVADGYTFTPSTYTMSTTAVSTGKTVEVEISDTYSHSKSVTWSQPKTTSTPDSHDYDLSGSAYRGVVTIKVYVYEDEANNGYRLGTPITLTGTVAEYVAPSDYTVTINPNGGAYAETPDGWTYDDVNGVYTKTVTGGTSFSAPDGLTKSTDGLSWKDDLDNDVTFPVTISSDITFVAQWTPYVESSNANLSALSVAGCTLNETFDASTTAYTIDLPFGSSMPAVSDVTATKADTKAEAPVVTISNNVITIACEAEDGTKKNYTITVTIAATKDIELVWATDKQRCDATTPSAVVKSNNAAVSTYINQITFTNVEGDGDDGAESGSLNVGKKAGNMFTLTAKAGYAFKAMSFYGKIEADDAKLEFSLNGGAWQDLASTASGDACYADVFSAAEVHELRMRSAGSKGFWIRNMQLTMIHACTPKTIAWTTEPAAEYEVGVLGAVIAAEANNGTVSYASTDGDVIAVNATTGALTVSALGTVTLSASVPAGDGTTYCDAAANVQKASINTYYLVKFDKQNETSVTEQKFYSNSAAIAEPSDPSYTGHTFQGWYDAATGGNLISWPLTPTASRTVYAHWTAACAGPTITAQPASANYLTGRVALALSCTATAGAEGELTYTWYSCDDALKTNPVALAGAPTPSTAAAGTLYYYCVVTEAGCAVERTSDVATITVADKDPVCIIKATPTSETEATADGAYKGNAYFKGRNSDKKLNSPYDYVGVKLASGYTFLATDKVVLNQTANLSSGDISKFYIFTEVPADGKTYVTVNNDSPVKGDNWFTMPAELVGESALYIGRVDDKCNPTVGYLAVYRAMAPELVSLSVNSIAATKSGSTFTVTLPAATNLASLSLTEVIAWNAPAASNSKQVTTNEGAWAWGDNTYVLTDKDGDATTYTITLNQAAAIKEVQISGTLSVQEGSTTTLTATVIDTYDAPAAIQDVTWTSDATSVATVDNGVVTGKTVGTANITATSVADGTKYATVEVTVTENLCREWNTPDNINDATISVGKIRMTHPSCGSSSKSPYSGASNVNMLKIEAQKGSSSKYFDIYFSDGALFESLELGLTAGSSDALNYAIAFCSASTFSEDKIISVEEYPANPNNVAQALNNIDLPDGTKSVRLYKSFQVDQETTKGSGSSIYIYHVAACKKEIVAVSGVTLNKTALSLPRRSSETLVATVAPSNATDKSVTWESDDETIATVDANGLVKAVGVGTANITATSVADGTKSATCEVTVTAFDCAGFTGNLFTLEVTTTSSQTYNIGNGTEVELLAAHVDVDGGHAYAGRDGSTKGDVSGYITASSNVACIRLQKANSMQGYLKVVLDDCTLRNSDVISFTQRAGEERSISITRTAEFSNAITTGDEYTVTQGDGLAGTNTFYVWYDGSQRVDVKTLTVTRVALVDITSVSLADMTIRTTKSRAPQLTTDPADGTILSVAYEIIGSTPASTIDPNTGVVTAGDDEEVFTVQVTVNGDKVATCEVTVVANLTQLDVEESTLWDFSKAGVTTNFTDEVLANVDGVTLDASQFNARQLVGSANNIASTYFQGTMLSFNATEPGLLSVRFTSGNNNARVLKVYDEAENVLAEWSYSGAATENESVEVPAGKVTLRSFQGEAANNVRIMRMEFYVLDMERNDSWIAPHELGTVCYPNGHIVVGADMYQMAGVDENGKFAFDQVEVTEPGVPYLFEATGYDPIKFYKTTAAAADEAGTSNGMVGTFVDKTLTPAEGENLYYFQGTHFYSVAERTKNLSVPANRCYVDLNEPHPAMAPKAGVRRISFGVHGTSVATGFENIEASEKPMKLMINGQLFILRGEKMFDATGRLVK